MADLPISAVFTDLDGTLLNSTRCVSTANLHALHELGRRNIVRVIATGRSLYSFKMVIDDTFPADYLIFSSGAGIAEIHSGRILKSSSLEGDDVSAITKVLVSQQADFMVHHPVPENHRFTYRRHNKQNEDFSRRIHLYRDYAEDYAVTGAFPVPAAQIIAILPRNTELFGTIKAKLTSYQVTRTTSPLDHTSIWMEIYPANVHKGSAAAWLCDHLHLDPLQIVGIGNDYNDLDLLDFAPHSYLLRNAPVELHDRYRLCRTNDDDGFAHAVHDVMTK